MPRLTGSWPQTILRTRHTGISMILSSTICLFSIFLPMADFELASTDSEISMATFNDSDHDTRSIIIPFSAYKWSQPSTLPSVPFEGPKDRARRQPREYDPDNPKIHPSNTSTNFPITDEFLAVEKKRFGRDAQRRARSRERKKHGRKTNIVSEAVARFISTAPDSGQPRRSARIAAQNTRKATQELSTRVNGNPRVTKSTSKHRPTSRANLRAPAVDPSPKRPSKPRKPRQPRGRKVSSKTSKATCPDV